MEIAFTQRAKEDLEQWKKSGDKKAQARIAKLIVSIQETPFAGIGKPEALKYELSGKWSRRITEVDRIVYSIRDETLYIHSLKGHY